MRPPVMLIVPVALSALAWAVPGESLQLRGFSSRTPLTLGGVGVVAAWYTLCILLLVAGGSLGRRLLPARDRQPSGVDRAVLGYRVLTLLSVVGVVASVSIAAAHGSIAAALAHHTANSLNSSLGRHAGIATLRYTAAIATPLGVVLAMMRRATWLEAGANLILLAVSSMFSSRLSLVLAAVVFVVIAVRAWPRARVNIAVLLIALAGAFGVLSVLNYFRNANYYVANGVDNVFAMNWFQVLSYLAAPFQVSLAWGNAVASGSFVSHENPGLALQSVVPTFLAGGIPAPGLNLNAVHPDVAHNLTTNSVFAEELAQYGWWGLGLCAVVLFVLAIVYGLTHRLPTATGLAAATIVYVDAEVWRIFLAREGIFVYLVAAAFAAGALAWSVERRLPGLFVVLTRGTDDRIPKHRRRSGEGDPARPEC